MITYIYDGSFDGLLSCIYKAFYSKEKPESIVSELELIENFLMEKEYIKADTEKSSRVYKAIEEKIGKNSLRKVFFTYLSNIEGREIIILRYLQLGFKMGKDVDLNLADRDVLAVDKIYRRVSKERHRLTGLLRFKRIREGILYAKVEPDHDVIGLLAPHFEKRLKNENFIIHDTKRSIAVFYNKEEWIIKGIESRDSFLVKEKEEGIYEDLWRVYFDSISIKRKTNPKLQRNNMPRRYWKNLTEKN